MNTISTISVEALRNDDVFADNALPGRITSVTNHDFGDGTLTVFSADGTYQVTGVSDSTDRSVYNGDTFSGTYDAFRSDEDPSSVGADIDQHTVNADVLDTTIIEDFGANDRITFEGDVSDGDVGVMNEDFTDGDVTLTAKNADVVLSGLGEDVDTQAWNMNTLEQAIGADVFGFA